MTTKNSSEIRIILDSDTFRANIRKKLADKFFQKYTMQQNTMQQNTIISPLTLDAAILLTTNMEKGILNWVIKEATNRKVVKKWDNPFFVRIYLDHLRSIYFNLQQNPHIIESIYNGEIKPQLVAFMTHQELCPEKWEEYIRLKIIRDKNKFEQNIEANTDSFTCRKCRSNKCSYYQLQTRSADEPMTSFITCITCGNRWKQ